MISKYQIKDERVQKSKKKMKQLLHLPISPVIL